MAESLHTVLNLFETQVSEDAKSWIDSACTSKKLTRDAFFEAAYWAILVANMNVATAQSWVHKASACGFPFDWRELGRWNDDDGKFDAWCKQMASGSFPKHHFALREGLLHDCGDFSRYVQGGTGWRAGAEGRRWS